MAREITEHHVGFAIENDYRWPLMAIRGSIISFWGMEKDLQGLDIKRLDERYPSYNISHVSMSPDLKKRVEGINALVDDTNQAAKIGDIDTVRRNYGKLGELIRNVPYDSQVIIEDWRKAGYIS